MAFPYPLEFVDVVIDGFQSSPNATTIPLTVGADYEPGDMRVVYVYQVQTTLNNVTGWTKRIDQAVGSGFTSHVGVYTQVLQSGAVDATLTLTGTGTGQWLTFSATIRNPFVGQTLSMTGAATSTSGSSAVSSSVSTPNAGAVLSFMHGSNTASAIKFGLPSGFTQLGDQFGVGTTYAAIFGKSTLSGTSGTITSPFLDATSGAPSTVTNGYVAQTLWLSANPDQTSALTAAAETDAGVAVTSALATTATNILTPAQEVDSGVEIYNPLRAVSIRPPVLLTDNPVSASRVSWSASTPAAGSAVLVETSLDGGASWQTATNGGAVSGLLRGDTTTPVVLTRATMTRLLSTDASPFFMTLKTEVSEDTSYNELVALGTFLITQVDVTETGGPTGGGSGGGGGGSGVTGSGGSSTGGGLSLVVSGIDLSYAISRNTWTEIFYAPSNTNYATAMLEIAQNRLPGITSDVASTEVTAERLLFGTSQGADAWQDIQDMGTAIGSRAYFDPVGTFKVKPVADPALTPSVWTVSDAANPVMVSYTRSISDSTTYNYVVVSGESTSNTVPVSAVAFDADPSSPTYYLGPYNIVTTTFISAMITTVAQAQQAADALLLVVKGASETVQITMVPNPALEPGDVITVTRTYNGQQIIQGTFKINSMSTPIGQAQAQVLVCYRQSAAQG